MEQHQSEALHPVKYIKHKWISYLPFECTVQNEIHDGFDTSTFSEEGSNHDQASGHDISDLNQSQSSLSPVEQLLSSSHAMTTPTSVAQVRRKFTDFIEKWRDLRRL